MLIKGYFSTEWRRNRMPVKGRRRPHVHALSALEIPDKPWRRLTTRSSTPVAFVHPYPRIGRMWNVATPRPMFGFEAGSSACLPGLDFWEALHAVLCMHCLAAVPIIGTLLSLDWWRIPTRSTDRGLPNLNPPATTAREGPLLPAGRVVYIALLLAARSSSSTE
jgi:hypothetical protein